MIRTHRGISYPFAIFSPRKAFGVRRGFTIFEALVIIAIMVLISGIIFASFPSLNQRIALQRATQDFSLAARQAQSMALSVRQVEDPAHPGTYTIPQAYNIVVDINSPRQYTLYGDLGGTPDYEAGVDALIEQRTLPSNISFGGLFTDIYGTNPSATKIVYTVSAPLGIIAVTPTPAGSPANACFVLRGIANSNTKAVVVQDSGYIAVQNNGCL